MKQTELYIPKALAQYVLTNKCVPQLRLYVYLKMSCSGKRRIKKPFVKKACKDLEIHRSTFYRLLAWLRSKKWVTKSHSGYYFVIGHSRLLQKENLKGNTAARFSLEWLASFEAFLSGSVIGYLVKHQRKAGRKKGRPNKPRPVATSALAQSLAIPQSTAYRLKRKAAHSGFITKKRDYRKTGIHIKFLDRFRACYPDISHKVVGYLDQVCVCLPDLCEERLKYKTMGYESL